MAARPARGRRLARGFGYLLAGLPAGIVAFVVAVAGFTSGVSTLVVWIGLPILVGTLYASRGLATVERRTVRWATGRELAPHHYRPARGHRVARRLLLALTDPQSWRDLLHSVVAFPVRVAAFAIAVSWAVGGLGGTLYVLWEWSLPRSGGDHNGLFGLLTGSSSRLGDIMLNTEIGMLLLLSLPWVVRGLVAELRALSRGIAPPILADRGLGAALAAAAARCPVPVSLDVALPSDERLTAAVENTAYFVVTEALTNVAKHSRATHCAVTVSTDGELVLVQVRDNGRGGAHLGKGHGLAGLGDRLAASTVSSTWSARPALRADRPHRTDPAGRSRGMMRG